MNSLEQAQKTRNQSTATIKHEHIFLFDNKYSQAIFFNDTGGDFVLKPGQTIIRDISNGKRVVPSVPDLTLAHIIGVISSHEEILLSNGEEIDIMYCHRGTVNENLLILPEGVNLETVPPETIYTVRTIIEKIGFHMENATDNTL